MSYNTNAQKIKPVPYVNPWYLALAELGKATISESKSMPKLRSDETGVKHTSCRHCKSEVRNTKGKRCDVCVKLIARYGVNRVERDYMYWLQEGQCANPGCSNEAEHIDHSHKTGEVREMLCNHCNKSLGALEEDPQRIAGLIQYIARHRETSH